MLEDPTVNATMFSTDTYKVFYKSYMEGNPNYDYGLQNKSLFSGKTHLPVLTDFVSGGTSDL